MLAKLPNAIVIENVKPEIDAGEYPVKAIPGERIDVTADIIKDGHDYLRARILFKEVKNKEWQFKDLKLTVNDHWEGSFCIEKEFANYVYTIEAWFDPIQTWLNGARKKIASDALFDMTVDVLEIVKLLKELKRKLSTNIWKGSRKQNEKETELENFIKELSLCEQNNAKLMEIVESDEFQSFIWNNPFKKLVTRYSKELKLKSERKLASYGAWYELFPRSQSNDKKVSGNFKTCKERLPLIKDMGFDVLYLPPIHPIGVTNRKGKNNTLKAEKDDVGSPWAIGGFDKDGKKGGHKSVHPDLGTIDDFKDFVKESNKLGIEIALDFAIQCSPDHPYVEQHPEWFYKQADGSIKYAENPPKKYQDIYPPNFYCEDGINLWLELKSIVEFWVDKGVKIFRVDNPHTKPYRFWEWLIADIHKSNPEVVFLAEAFTRPKIMKFLAKAGFQQSYTYFTWRNNKADLMEYLTELTKSEMKDYYRGNFFTNTPDILHEYLQKGGEPAFKIRLFLAATLSSIYGIYSGFEFCENVPVKQGSEEYLNSEKYEIRPRDYSRRDTLIPLISKINSIRRSNLAFHLYKNLEFVEVNNPQVIGYYKYTDDYSNIVICFVSLNPYQDEEATVEIPVQRFGLSEDSKYSMKDLIKDIDYEWKGSKNYVKLNTFDPAHIFLLTKI